MIETFLQKRQSLHAGEIGLFPSSQMAEEDLQLFTNGTEVEAQLRSPINIKLQRYMWALATLVGRSVEGCHDKEDGIELLCIKCRHMRHKLDPVTGKLEITRKKTRNMGNEALKRLVDRMIYVTCTEIIAGLEEGALRAELESMVGADYRQAPTVPRGKPSGRRVAKQGAAENARRGSAGA